MTNPKELYSNAIVLRAIEDIKAIIGEAFKSISYQSQDNGDFLLMRIQLMERPNQQDLKDWYKSLKEHFSKVFPKPRPGQRYSWMINIEHDNWPLETVMDEIDLS